MAKRKATTQKTEQVKENEQVQTSAPEAVSEKTKQEVKAGLGVDPNSEQPTASPAVEDAADDKAGEPVADTPSDHPALAPNGNAIHNDKPLLSEPEADEPVTVPAGVLGGREAEVAEDTEFVGEDGSEGVIKAGAPILEDNAEPSGFDHPSVLARIKELNSDSIIAQGEQVKVSLGSQSFEGTVAGHDVNKGQVSYHISVQVQESNFIAGIGGKTLELPIPAEYVSK